VLVLNSYYTSVFILANSKCHQSGLKRRKEKEQGREGKLIPPHQKANFQSAFPWMFVSASLLRIPAEESLLIFHVLVDEKAIRIMG